MPYSHGHQYDDLFFNTLELKEEYNGYDRLLVLAYRINEKDRLDAKGHTNNGRDENIPDYDKSSGNIHPSKNRIIEEYKNNPNHLIKQIVLAKKSDIRPTGPNKSNNDIEYDDLESFDLCYYPTIKEDGKYDDNLKEFWDNIDSDKKVIIW